MLGASFDFAQDMLCAFARDIAFSISFSIQNFKMPLARVYASVQLTLYTRTA